MFKEVFDFIFSPPKEAPQQSEIRQDGLEIVEIVPSKEEEIIPEEIESVDLNEANAAGLFGFYFEKCVQLKKGMILVGMDENDDIPTIIGQQYTIIRFSRADAVFHHAYSKKPQNTYVHLQDQLGAEHMVKIIDNDSFLYADSMDLRFLNSSSYRFCFLEDLPKYQHILDGNKTYHIEFKIKKRENTGEISIWIRSNNYRHRDWIPIKSKVAQSCNCDIYIFEDETDARAVIQYLNTFDLEQRKDFLKQPTFERRWMDL